MTRNRHEILSKTNFIPIGYVNDLDSNTEDTQYKNMYDSKNE